MEYIIILVLFAYIAFLHYQLNRKNIFIETLVEKYARSEKDWSKESLAEMLKKIQSSSPEVSVKPSKLFDEDVMKFIIGDEKKCNSFIHYTKEKEIAKKIISDGFKFVDTFYKTAEPITNDKLDLIYKHYLHKHYGNYVVIISISKQVYDKYLEEISKIKKVVNVEQILSEKSPLLNENLDEVYLLPTQYVKGYIDAETGEITNNPNFDSNYDSLTFKKNLDALE
ncbi:MAG TPA: hypothetical protein PL017_04380 [Tenuifilaceae bacterium]|nr:hypothetical protein [Tenuifilaceae bacterium]HPE17792.1 hypothetical protein [Tenuifilaceae bacterium]HPJ45311.1 hypothetical protein [Tenuifilaceae bacterium]HPQ33658.1 hypothetical protein [Tenuifilaceae bacterium]HRX67276.1 hypothetical protein [Tenuifilaceae bacterium]